ncbi:MAG: thiol peroxidase [Campylobacter sp.]|nr:thiol peroxidase [Campylobacter sp.]
MTEVKFQGTAVKLVGEVPNVGDKAPLVTLAGADLSDVNVGNANGKVQVVLAVPSLDTPVCASEARKFNEKVAKLANTEVVVVSMDLPFAMGRFCTTEGIANLKTASDFRNKKFAKSYGLLIDEGPLAGLNARAVFVIDSKGLITYKELCADIANEPDYNAALNAATAAK